MARGRAGKADVRLEDGTVTGVRGHEDRIADRRVVPPPERGAEELARVITERLQVKAELAALKAELAALKAERDRHTSPAEQVDDMVFTLDREGALTYASPRAREALGLSSDTLSDREFLELVLPDDRELAAESLRRALRGALEPTLIRTSAAPGAVWHWSLRAVANLARAEGSAVVASGQDVSDLVRERTGRLLAEAKTEASLARLDQTMYAAANTLARVVQVQDPYTAGHQKRVAELASAIGNLVGLPARTAKCLHLAALIHDIGKIAVPSQVLNRPGSVDTSLWPLIREHAETGYWIVRGMVFPGPVARIIREHHERWDGSGYARGLRGDKIHRASHILAVADVVEAMSANRPYRPALGMDAALAQIESRAGKQYDRRAAEACLHLFRERDFRFQHPSWCAA